MSPTMAMRSPSKPPAPSAGADRVAVEQRLGGVLVPAVAGVDDAGVGPAGDLPRHAGRAVADDDGVDAHRRRCVSTVSRRLSPLFTLDEPTPRRSSCRPTAAWPRSRSDSRVRVESSKNSDTTVLPRSAGTFGIGRRVDLDHVVGQVEQLDEVRRAPSSSIERRCCVVMAVARSTLADARRRRASRRPSSSRAGRQVLAHVVGPDRQLAVAAVDQHGELHRPGPAVVVERVEGGPHGAAGEEHVVDEDDAWRRRGRPGCRVTAPGTTGRRPMSSR